MAKVEVKTYIEELNKSSEILSKLSYRLIELGYDGYWPHRLANALLSMTQGVDVHFPSRLNRVVYDKLAQIGASPRGRFQRSRRGETDPNLMRECGRNGGSSHSRKKAKASRTNGKKGGRPSPDKRTQSLAETTLRQLQAGNIHAWRHAANHVTPPRILRHLTKLMAEKGITNRMLSLPEEWDPMPGSKDKYTKYGQIYRNKKMWPKSVPVRDLGIESE
jgi:hypothetical protein